MPLYVLACEITDKANGSSGNGHERNDTEKHAFEQSSVRAMEAIGRRARAGAARERGDRSVSSESRDAASAQINIYAALSL